MQKRMKIMIVSLTVIFGGIIGFNAFKQVMIKRFFAHYQPPAISVASFVAKSIDWQPKITTIGNFVAINGVEVNTQTAGNVTAIHFQSGQYIKKDELLVDLDDQIEQAELKNSQAELALKALNYQRQVDLFKHGATATSNLDEAKATLAQAQANLERIQAGIQHKHIQAPFSGQLGIRQVNLGQYLTPGATAIVSLQSLDPLYLQFNLPEQDYKHLRLNQTVQIRIEEFPHAIFRGKITAINSKADANSHTILVQATLPNCPRSTLEDREKSTLIKMEKIPNSSDFFVECSSEMNENNHITQFLFLPGMFASAAIEQPPVPNVIVLPSTAISYSLYGNSVFIIENKDDQKDKQGNPVLSVRRVYVNTGEEDGNFTVIKSGIEAGQIVVSSGELKLENGTQVVINNDVPLHETSDFNQLGQ